MGRRTLQASETGIREIKKAMKLRNHSQDYLAAWAGCVRQTIGRLLQGHPVDEDVFKSVCKELGLNLQAIIVVETEIEANEQKIKDLIAEVRQQIQPMVKKECGTMQVFDARQDITLEGIFTDVNILETLTFQQRIGLDELHCLVSSDLDKFRAISF